VRARGDLAKEGKREDRRGKVFHRDSLLLAATKSGKHKQKKGTGSKTEREAHKEKDAGLPEETSSWRQREGDLLEAARRNLAELRGEAIGQSSRAKKNRPGVTYAVIGRELPDGKRGQEKRKAVRGDTSGTGD